MSAKADDLTLVLDIGKSHAKLLMIDAAGAVVERHGRDNRSVVSALGYPALDIAGLSAWMLDTLAASPATRRCKRAIASTHGAAFVALGDGGPAWEPLDYEFTGVAEAALDGDSFDLTLSPDLPAGLNAARQLNWLHHHHPAAWARTRALLPYPQYWAWWLSGVVASEVSSLGCHTHLWSPTAGAPSPLAQRSGWADLMAPLQPAWAVLGPVRSELARTGLPPDCQVHVGVHDSNACLARYLHGGTAMTLVSTGTWVVVMAPGASASALDPARDMLGNVSVRGELVPTARFMGGRELEALCAGASPTLASVSALRALLHDDVRALPSFTTNGGPFVGQVGTVTSGGRPIAVAGLSAEARATLAAFYCAQVTACLVDKLGAATPVVLEGPFADNPVYVQALAALLPTHAVAISTDPVEGTARGAWLLTRWQAPDVTPTRLHTVQRDPAMPPLPDHHRRWWP